MRGYDITEEQRDELVRVYVAQGTAAAAPLAEKYGVCRRYPSILARDRGLSKKAPRTDNDPRWALAISRGPVCA